MTENNPIKFKAAVKGFSVDEDGECKLTLRIPQNFSHEAHLVSFMVKEVLDVEIKRETAKREYDLK